MLNSNDSGRFGAGRAMAQAAGGRGAAAGERAQEQELVQWKDISPMGGTDVRVTGTLTDIL